MWKAKNKTEIEREKERVPSKAHIAGLWPGRGHNAGSDRRSGRKPTRIKRGSVGSFIKGARFRAVPGWYGLRNTCAPTKSAAKKTTVDQGTAKGDSRGYGQIAQCKGKRSLVLFIVAGWKSPAH